VLIDDWVETGSQSLAVRRLVESQGGLFLGLVAMVDGAREGIADALPLVAALVEADDLQDEGS